MMKALLGRIRTVFRMPLKSVALLVIVFGCLPVVSSSLIDYALIPRQLFLSVLLPGLIFGFISTNQMVVRTSKPTMLAFGFLLLWLFASVFSYSGSVVFAEYLNEVGRVVGYTSFFMVCLVASKDGVDQKVITRVVSIVLILLACIGLVQFRMARPEFTIDGMMAVTGLMSNKNLFSEYLALLIPLSVLGMVIDKSKWRFIHALSVFVALILILVLMARSSWLALFISFVVGLVLVAKHSGSSKSQFKLWYLAPASLSLIVLVNWLTDNAIFTRLLSLLDYQSGSSGYRLVIWEQTIEMIQQSPLFGVGAGNWKIAFQQYGLSNDLDTFTTQTLNDYLSVFAESGILGFIGYGGFLVVGVCQAVKASISSNEEDRLFKIALACSIITYAIISFFNFPKNRIEHFLFLLFVVWQSTSLSEGPRVNVRLSVFNSVLVPALLFFSFFFFQRLHAETRVREALESRSTSDWRSVTSELEKVDYNVYPLDPTTTPVSWYKGIAHFELKEFEKAFGEFKSAYELNPHHIHVLNNLATSYEIKGEHDQAIMLYERALKLNPYFPDALLNLVAVYYNQGNYKKALELIDSSKVTTAGKVRSYRSIVVRQMNKNGIATE